MKMEDEKKSKEFWKAVLGGDKILTDKEAAELKSVCTSLRREGRKPF